MKLTNKIEALLYKNEKIKSLLLSDSIEIEDYKSMKKECEVQKKILEETLTTTDSMIQKIIDIVKNGITRISHLSELYKVLSTDEKKEMINYLFPHYIIYTESCFTHTNISESLQFIYTESYRPGHIPQMQAPAMQHIPNSAIIDDTSFFKELIINIVSDNLYIVHKQAREIVSFSKELLNSLYGSLPFNSNFFSSGRIARL